MTTMPAFLDDLDGIGVIRRDPVSTTVHLTSTRVADLHAAVARHGLTLREINRYAATVELPGGPGVGHTPVVVLVTIPAADVAAAFAQAFDDIELAVADLYSSTDQSAHHDDPTHPEAAGIGLVPRLAGATRPIAIGHALSGPFGSPVPVPSGRGEILSVLLADAGVGSGEGLDEQFALRGPDSDFLLRLAQLAETARQLDATP